MRVARPVQRQRCKSLLGLGLALWSTCTPAAREVAVFDVSVSIPTSDFYILPVNPGFFEREQVLHWNPVNSRLSSLRESFDVKNSTGGITARLDYLPYLSNGKDRIGLRVTFNGELLGLDDTLVVTEPDAKSGKRVPLDIAAIEPVDGYLPGSYFGNVLMTFDALRP